MVRPSCDNSPYVNIDLLSDLFKTNAGVIADLTAGIAAYCPKAFVCIITNPVNSTVPIAVEVLKSKGVFNPTRVFGVTTLDVVRASTFVAHVLDIQNPQDLKIPVVGGHSGATILPLISQSQPPVKLSQEQIDAITYRMLNPRCRVMCGADQVKQAFNSVAMKL